MIQVRSVDLLLQKVTQPPLLSQLQQARGWVVARQLPTARELVRYCGNGMTVQTSCVTAIVLALGHLDSGFEQLLQAARACGGDVDTISAMAGSIWGARRGARSLPPTRIEARDAK